MKRLFIFWVILLPALTQHVHAQYYSVNYDARTVAAMAAAFGTEAVAESYYREQVDDILKSYVPDMAMGRKPPIPALGSRNERILRPFSLNVACICRTTASTRNLGV